MKVPVTALVEVCHNLVLQISSPTTTWHIPLRPLKLHPHPLSNYTVTKNMGRRFSRIQTEGTRGICVWQEFLTTDISLQSTTKKRPKEITSTRRPIPLPYTVPYLRSNIHPHPCD
ncbi:biosynthetic-type acetolactate synthase large subunit [Sesbania bispinosa]|nr:biosynthetic-type acetolactate synthase large subunit [Sesbania bispinosa]